MDLGDVRLNRRARRVLGKLAERPQAGLSQALGGQADLTAAYALFAHAEVTPQRLLESHYDHTLMRIMQQRRVLLVQDTTELIYSSRARKMSELGPLNSPDSAGLYVHPLLAVTPERLPLGLVGVDLWTRAPEDYGKKHLRKKRAFEEKESMRWRDAYQRAGHVARQAADTQIVCVADAEADVYECFVEGAAQLAGDGPAAHWLIRAGQDRAVCEAEGVGLWETMAQAPLRDTYTLSLRATPKRAAREAQLTIRTAQVRLRPPARSEQPSLPEVTVNVVWVQEINAPPDAEPVEWMLLTSLPIHTLEQVHQIVQDYTCRWEIEVFFRVLKSGCTVEQLQLETFARLTNCLALYLIVAWRVLYVMKLGRACPNLPCTVCFGDDEWQPVWQVVRHEAPPATPPPLQNFLRVLARLGGYLDRKRDPPPGPQTLWIGLRRLHDLSLAWRTFGPASKTYP